MADQQSSSVLPPLGAAASEKTGAGIEVPPISINLSAGPSSKEIMIGAGAWIVLAIIFFVIRNAYVNYLVGSLKRSPNNAGMAGWGIFGGLLFGSAIGCIAIVGTSFLTLPLMAPLAAISMGCFTMGIVLTLKK